MATVRATPEELFQLIQDLRDQLAKGQRVVDGPYVHGEADLWAKRTQSLIQQALGDEHYCYDAFVNARRFSVEALHGDEREKDRIHRLNRDNFVRPRLPPLDDAIAEAEKLLAKMTGGSIPSGPVAPPASALPTVDFAFVKDDRLRMIATRDYKELRVAIYYRMAKSTAVLGGSVIEAVLLDKLLQAGKPAGSLEHQTLGGLYQMAKAVGVVAGRGDSAASAVRDSRNFVHAGVEYRSGALTEHDADLAVSLMKVTLQELGAIAASA